MRALNFLIGATVIGLITQVYLSGGSLGDFAVLLCLIVLVFIRWQFQQGRLMNAHLWVFAVINVISVLFALTSPSSVVIVLAAPLAALTMAVLWLPRKFMTLLTVSAPVLMAIINLIGHGAGNGPRPVSRSRVSDNLCFYRWACRSAVCPAVLGLAG
ncbi:MAG: hypothetical protein IPO29_01865 [Anaerolineae bacterium]|nr:hypothetical protein [Anaerolineae bacterium]